MAERSKAAASGAVPLRRARVRTSLSISDITHLDWKNASLPQCDTLFGEVDAQIEDEVE